MTKETTEDAKSKESCQKESPPILRHEASKYLKTTDKKDTSKNQLEIEGQPTKIKLDIPSGEQTTKNGEIQSKTTLIDIFGSTIKKPCYKIPKSPVKILKLSSSILKGAKTSESEKRILDSSKLSYLASKEMKRSQNERLKSPTKIVHLIEGLATPKQVKHDKNISKLSDQSRINTNKKVSVERLSLIHI